MSKEIGILVIHGMGSQGPDFADPMIEEINGRLDDKHGKDPDKVAWKPVYWADILEPKELKFFNEVKSKNELDFISLRKFILTALGDVAAYQKHPSSTNTTYEKIHSRVKGKIKELRAELGSHDKPLIFMAHSQGGVIMSNYIWDIQKSISDTSDMSSFEKMETLSGIVTFGCPMPMFTFAYDNVDAIKFPPAALPADLKQKAKWLNYYDRDDILGYPLKQISTSYENTVTKDKEINVGSILSSWNPMSHSAYWTDNDFTKPVSEYIAEFI